MIDDLDITFLTACDFDVLTRFDKQLTQYSCIDFHGLGLSKQEAYDSTGEYGGSRMLSHKANTVGLALTDGLVSCIPKQERRTVRLVKQFRSCRLHAEETDPDLDTLPLFF